MAIEMPPGAGELAQWCLHLPYKVQGPEFNPWYRKRKKRKQRREEREREGGRGGEEREKRKKVTPAFLTTFTTSNNLQIPFLPFSQQR